MSKLTFSCMTPRLRTLLKRGPEPGSSHLWLLRVANELARMNVAESLALQILTDLAPEVPHREVPMREIETQVHAAYHTAPSGPRWPAFDESFFSRTLASAPVIRLVPLNREPPDLLGPIFQPHSLVCHGTRVDTPKFDRFSDACLSDSSFIVPNSFLSADRGRRESNVTGRRTLVLESDVHPIDVQAQLLYVLSHEIPMVVVAFSGGKSLHGWYDVRSCTGDEVDQFFAQACRLGFDRAMYSPHQFCRVPGGTRYTEGDTICQQPLELSPS